MAVMQLAGSFADKLHGPATFPLLSKAMKQFVFSSII